MNIKELLIVVVLALVTTKGVEYLLFSRQKEEVVECARPGESFIAPRTNLKPINTEVDFMDQKAVYHDLKAEVETDLARLTFSSHGASLERLEFKKGQGAVQTDITTIFPVAVSDRERRCFLVALDERTPYYYQLSARTDHEDRTELVYSADFYAGRIEKTFTIFKTLYRIDMKLNLLLNADSAQESVGTRIFYLAPVMPSIALQQPAGRVGVARFIPTTSVQETVAGVVNNERNQIEVLARKTLEDRGWFNPTFFGAENRYFVHAMINDQDHFAQRGYYSLTGVNELSAILEGPAITTTQAWTLSFYFGPKERSAMAINPLLEQTLGFSGWFGALLAPIAKWLMILLNLLYRYLGNYGWAIIALTILIKLVLLPFSLKSAQSMKKNSEIQHKLKYLQQKYKDNPERLAQERVELMRKEGMPGLAGCLPLLMQLPIFFALNRLLATSIELYQAPFAVWSDLSAPDPFYVLPILIVLVMLWQSTTIDPKQRMTMVLPALVLGALAVTLPVGLCLYIAVSTFLGALQPFIQNKLKMA